MSGKCFSVEVHPKIPAQLERLSELADDLYYSWSTQVRALFYYLHPELWAESSHNPKLFLRRIAQHRLEKAANDLTFLKSYHMALADYDNYLNEPARIGKNERIDPDTDLVAYFSMEFGFHESVPIYSGGLGILAADHCKAASDVALPLVAIGLLYRQGYFLQTIDGSGHQQAQFNDTDFTSLPISLVKDENGKELTLCIDELEDPICLRIWQAKAGRIRLYLLDSDVDENSDYNRTITHQLYGGDNSTRILQEIVLGIGGVRAIHALGLKPSVWHINEGHGALQILERCRELTIEKLAFDSAIESVAAATVFTTHTPVQAGHDIFTADLVKTHLSKLSSELGLSIDDLIMLGSSPSAQGGFNMTALALRGSRYHNGVSKIHGDVASEMEAYIWPQISEAENPIGYVTNGVHLHSFLAPEWRNLFDMELGYEWRNQLLSEKYWDCIDNISDYGYWSIRQTLKSQLLKDSAIRITRQFQRNGSSPIDLERTIKQLNPSNTNTLVIGFARRFATYKRAALIFRDKERLARLVNDPKRPVIFIFAGKAHPSDEPGQQLISMIYSLSQEKWFQGKIILLEDYNLAMARRLVTGVDVWLNTPEYPLEASGTSGQKAGLNGVINLSVLDGWWEEGFNGTNGWGISPHPTSHADERDMIESQTILDVIEHNIIPTYFRKDGMGYSEDWVRISKASMKTILPKYNSQRMLMDYVNKYYVPAIQQGKKINRDQYKPAIELAAWKSKIHRFWPQVTIHRVDQPVTEIETGDTIPIVVGINPGELDAKDIVVECLVGRPSSRGELLVEDVFQLQPEDSTKTDEVLFRLDLLPKLAGLQYYKLRAYPYHELLTHQFELGYMIWL
jgi:starch phosphorylase